LQKIAKKQKNRDQENCQKKAKNWLENHAKKAWVLGQNTGFKRGPKTAKR